MKNVLIGILSSISVILSGYIIYDNFIKEEKNVSKVEDKCQECNCEENNNYYLEEDKEGTYTKTSSGVYDKNGKIHKLDIYQITQSGDIEFNDIKINNKQIKIVIKDDGLYVNDKKTDYYADYIYVTNNHAYLLGVGQSGLCFEIVIDSTGKITNLHDNNTIGDFQASDIYLNENGDLVAIGNDFCFNFCDEIDKELIKFSYQNNKLQITKEKLK